VALPDERLTLPVGKEARGENLFRANGGNQDRRNVPRLLDKRKLVKWPALSSFFHHLAHSARADLCRRLGRIPEARASYERALALAQQEPDRRFLARRLEELG
jgi:predicted RNA polymerase sigma factor